MILLVLPHLNKGRLLLVSSWNMASRGVSSLIHDKAYVDGQWVAAKSGNTFEVLNPSTGSVVGVVPDMNADDVDVAVKKAYQAFLSWKETTAKERSDILRRFYDLSCQHQDELAKLITEENGKPLSDSKGEVAYGNGFIEWNAEEAKRVYGDIIPSSVSSKRILVLKQPIGVCGMITPWNFPHAMITRKACTALAAGCTVVLRPSEDTPLTALALCELAEKAGCPKGVINVVTSSRENAAPIGKHLCEHPLVKKISFTGSTHVGKILLQQSASTVKKVSLELGGNAPFIVFDSADVDAAVTGTMMCKFRCSGQTCVCANRIMIQEGVYDEYVKRLADRMKQELFVGDGFTDGITQGPLVNERAVQKVEDLVKDATSKGAQVVLGGKRHDKGGNFYEPTLLKNISTEMKCVQEEIFGPVASVMKFKTEEEAIAIANATSVGLAAYFYSQDVTQVFRVMEKLEVGICGVNEGILSTVQAPFGGVKESGLGREGSKYGIEDYTEIKYVCIGGLK
ncbi:succinate-semialdehyde dehydrogenase, mitochondrial-like [Gigantopelta aegis]|uniref:succinate-semialdehyde dehydrogenase, mitochondrial-like n=1 Tax=Gigantopelta aegis TaxID=1735272 RepID=UPI001B88ABD9|nr:succinate-semialdehyde dehydrogenase, mitochondrial-like [Gigantopelta aegis]XP_041351815.1 succinate-semialdehyde dehydrogenase, mitochondrial-like [Gigantopelta aegis]